MSEYIQIVTTTPNREMAVAIARELVAKRLAACAQVAGPVTSTYRWQGAIETADEWVCVGKCRQEHYDSVEKLVRQLHSYDVPEVVAVPIVAGSKSYLEWLHGETEQPT